MSFDKVRNLRNCHFASKSRILIGSTYKNLDDDHRMGIRYIYTQKHKNRTWVNMNVFGMKKIWWNTYSLPRFSSAINHGQIALKKLKMNNTTIHVEKTLRRKKKDSVSARKHGKNEYK